MRRSEQIRDFDWITISICLALMITGWLMVYSSEYDNIPPKSIFDLSESSGKQFLFIIVGLIVAIFILIIDGTFFRTFAFGFYIIGLIGLLVVLVFAREVNGARAWVDMGGGFKFQGAEFAKTSTALALAAYLGSYNFNLANAQMRFRAIGIILLPMLLILLQKDDGSMLVYGSLFLVLYRAGMASIWYALAAGLIAVSILALLFDPLPAVMILLTLGIVLLLQNAELRQLWWFATGLYIIISIILFAQGLRLYIIVADVLVLLALASVEWRRKWQFSGLVLGGVLAASIYSVSIYYVFNKALKPHQQERINMWLHPEKANPRGPIINIIQSKMAIGAGGMTGTGYLGGSLTKYKLSEQNTDFIFCTVGEEQGFLGSLLLIVLYTTLLLRILYIAERQRSGFSRFYAYGVACIIFTHFFINIGMTVNIMPVIGIPLPFISYGGSSLLSFTIMMAVLIKLDSNRLLVFR